MMPSARGLVHDNDAEQGVPGAQLAQPLAHHRGRAHDQRGTELAAVVQPCQESCHLYTKIPRECDVGAVMLLTGCADHSQSSRQLKLGCCGA